MIDLLTSLGSPYWSGFGTALSLIGTIFGLYGFLRRHSARLYFERRDYTVLPPINVPGAIVSVALNGATGSELHLTTLFIVNKTSGGVDDADFVGTPFSVDVRDGTVFECRQVKIPSSCEYQVAITDTGVSIYGIRSPKGTGILIEIWHDGCLAGPVKSNTRGSLKASPYKLRELPIDGFLFVTLGLLAALSGMTIVNTGKLVFDNTDLSIRDLLWTFGPPTLIFGIVAMQFLNKNSSKFAKILIRTDAERDYINYRAQTPSPVASPPPSR